MTSPITTARAWVRICAPYPSSIVPSLFAALVPIARSITFHNYNKSHTHTVSSPCPSHSPAASSTAVIVSSSRSIAASLSSCSHTPRSPIAISRYLCLLGLLKSQKIQDLSDGNCNKNYVRTLSFLYHSPEHLVPDLHLAGVAEAAGDAARDALALVRLRLDALPDLPALTASLRCSFRDTLWCWCWCPASCSSVSVPSPPLLPSPSRPPPHVHDRFASASASC